MAMNKRLFWILVSGGALVLLLCIGIIVYALVRVAGPYVGPVGTEGEIARIRARGEPVTLAELAGPSVPDSQNAASLYEKAFALLPPSAEGDRAGGDAGGLRSLLRRARTADDPKAWAEVRAIASRHAGAIEAAKLAAARPRCRFGVKTDQGFPEYQHLSKLRTLVSLIAASAMLQARDGDTSGALDTIAVGLRVGESVKDDYGLTPQSRRIAYVRTNLRALRYVLSHHRVSPEQAQRIDSLLSRMDFDRGFVRALQGERAVGIWLFERVRKDGIKAFEEFTGDSGDLSNPGVPGLPINTVLKAAVKPDEAFFLKEMDRRIRSVDVSFREARARGTDTATRFPKYAFMSSILIGVYDRARATRDMANADVRGGRIALALVAHRSQNSAYPESLDALEPSLSANILLDPFSGKQFVYKREGRGFVLYSFGSNLTDDGGKEADPRRGSPTDLPGDIVWRSPI